MTPRFTIKQLEQLKADELIRDYKVSTAQVSKDRKRSKYGNKKTEIDGILFASNREAGRYIQLRFLERYGSIKELRLQVPFELNDGGNYSFKYVADFVYVDPETGLTVVEDSKGCRTAVYKKKRRLMLEVHGIEIQEV